MAKENITYYACVLQADLIYKSRVTRQDEMVNIFEPAEKMRYKRFYAADPYKNRSADILGLRDGRELQWYYTEVREKMVSRPQINRDGTPMSHKREMRPKMTKIKFVKLEPDEVTESMRARALILPIREMDLIPIKTNEGTDTTEPAKSKKKRVSGAKKNGEQAKKAS